MKNKKLWAGRFSEATSNMAEEFNASIFFDKKLALYDVKGSIVHAKMLCNQGIISELDLSEIIKGLEIILKEISEDSFIYSQSDEDVHMAVERRLISIIGETGGKLHTARSRNDQVALDIRLYMRDILKRVMSLLNDNMRILLSFANKTKEVVMPGYTHLQIAQPISFAQYVLAYFQMLKRDYKRFSNILDLMNYCPLGACALAGTSFPIDRHYVAKQLNFINPTENSLDSVSDRDFALDFLSASSILMMHLSRFCEELILFSSSEFNFITLSDRICTGSSIMPQKKNPDIPELIRGKSGRVYGSLVALLTTMKGLPLAYNKDMQEDKEGIFDASETIINCLLIFSQLLKEITINEDVMLKASGKGYSTATDLADYLVIKGEPFRRAHHIAGSIVKYAIANNKTLEELTLNEYHSFSDIITEDIFETISVKSSVKKRNSYGGTGEEALKIQIENAELYLSGLPKYE